MPSNTTSNNHRERSNGGAEPAAPRGVLGGGLAARIYLSFLVIALVPALLAGLVGIYYSLDALKRETLTNLESEVNARADAIGRFVDQLASELLYLSNSSSVVDLVNGARDVQQWNSVRDRVENDFALFASTYPYIYQIRVIARDGHELARVDRRNDRAEIVPVDELQDKSERYYVRDALQTPAGRLYVSQMDLNVERGEIETPERPVVRFATGVFGDAGEARGIVIINLHADFILRDVRELAGTRGGEAYLFDRSGHFLQWSAAGGSRRFDMRPVSESAMALPESVLSDILAGGRGTTVSGDRIVAYSPVATASRISREALPWTISLAFPERLLFAAVFNLYLLYGVLALSLVLTAAGGFLLSRRLLRPLSRLQEESQAIALGHFSHRVNISGSDEIADLGASFNTMAARIEEMVGRLSRRKQELEDLVAERTAQIALQRQNLETVVQNTADGILGLDANGSIEIANQAAERILDIGRDKLIGARTLPILPQVKPLLKPGLGASRVRFERNQRTLDAIVSAVSANDSGTKYVVVLRDMSEEKRLQDERRELDRQVFQTEKIVTMGELAMGIAHEIGNPLTGMKAVTQALLDEELDDHTRRYLSRLEHEIDRLSAFLRPFHGYSATLEAHPVPTNLGDAVEDVLLWTRKEAKSKGITIGYARPESGDVWLDADPNQLAQLLLNLVINAIHACEQGGRVNIRVQAPADASGVAGHARIVVEDDGSGIPDAIRERVFDLFFTTRSDGTGIGLAIVKRIASEHGATINIVSAPGEGTRIELLWPLATAIGSTTASTA